MFNIIFLQIDVAKEKLPRENLQDVINACIQVLREVQRGMYDTIVNGWKDMPVEALVAAVNDNQRLQDKCDEFAIEVETMVPNEDYRVMLTSGLEEVSSEFINLAVTASNFLARVVLEDVKESVFDVLFTPTWEKENISRGAIIIKTLEDYIEDLIKWLPKYFFTKFLREVIQLIATLYTEAITSQKRQKGDGFEKFQIPNLKVAQKLMTDKEELIIFFDNYKELLQQVQIDTRNELSCLNHLIHLLSAAHASGVTEQANAIFKRWDGLNKADTGLLIVHAALCSGSTQSKEEKIQNKRYTVELYENFKRSKLIRTRNKKSTSSHVHTSPGQSGVGGNRTEFSTADAMINAYTEAESTKKQKRRLSLNNLFRGDK
jgi:hypothetical protein